MASNLTSNQSTRKLGKPPTDRQKRVDTSLPNFPLHHALLLQRRAEELGLTQGDYLGFVLDWVESRRLQVALHCPKCGAELIQDAEIICPHCDFWVETAGRPIHK